MGLHREHEEVRHVMSSKRFFRREAAKPTTRGAALQQEHGDPGEVKFFSGVLRKRRAAGHLSHRVQQIGP